jgi:hypothetical protein
MHVFQEIYPIPVVLYHSRPTTSFMLLLKQFKNIYLQTTDVLTNKSLQLYFYFASFCGFKRVEDSACIHSLTINTCLLTVNTLSCMFRTREIILRHSDIVSEAYFHCI